MLYNERAKEEYLPDYMQDPISYYLHRQVTPTVFKYSVKIIPVHNGVVTDFSPILFEKGDHLDIMYTFTREGPVNFNTYMQFMHEAYKSDELNLSNAYSGSWSLVVWLINIRYQRKWRPQNQPKYITLH